MPGERITLKTREKIPREERNWVKEEEKGEETERATSRSLGRFTPPREKYQGKITLFSSSTIPSPLLLCGVFEGQRVRRRPAGLGEGR